MSFRQLGWHSWEPFVGTWLSRESIMIRVCTQHRKSWPPDVTIFLETFST